MRQTKPLPDAPPCGRIVLRLKISGKERNVEEKEQTGQESPDGGNRESGNGGSGAVFTAAVVAAAAVLFFSTAGKKMKSDSESRRQLLMTQRQKALDGVTVLTVQDISVSDTGKIKVSVYGPDGADKITPDAVRTVSESPAWVGQTSRFPAGKYYTLYVTAEEAEALGLRTDGTGVAGGSGSSTGTEK